MPMDSHNLDFINEFKFCASMKDVVKAVALMQFFPSLDETARKKILFEIFKAPDLFAYPVLEALTRVEINNPLIKEKIRELILEKSYDNTDRIVEYIRKRDRKNKVLYIRIAGELRIRDARPALEEILALETDTEVIVETLQAIGKIGVKSSATIIGDFIHSNNPEQKTATINALAELGGSKAVEKLYEGLTGESRTDLVILQALASIQDLLSIEKLTELLSSQFVDLRNAAIDHLIDMGPKAILVVTENLEDQDNDTIIHRLNVLGYIGDVTALPAIQRIIYNIPDDANVRFAVYEAMERLPSSKSAMSLAQGLTDPEEHVRMAAAKAVDKNLSTVLIAGMKNMIEAGDAQSEMVTAVLLDSGADNAFNFLLDNDTFVKNAMKHLSESAHPDVCAHFVKLLENKGELQLAKKITESVSEKSVTKKPLVYAVDDSKMMLKIYMRKLYDMGYDSETFEFPADALKALKTSKPDLLITDLNMPGINGIQMCAEIRKMHSPSELPIVMVTTQSEIADQSARGNTADINKELIVSAGISRILQKPFDDADLKEALTALIKK